MRYIDLTRIFNVPMPVYPGDPAPSLSPVGSVAGTGWLDHELRTTMHVGTHIDAPAHMIEGGVFLSEVPIERFFGPGVLVDAVERLRIDEHLLEGVKISPASIVLVHTGMAQYYGQLRYYESFPQVTAGFVDLLVRNKVSIVGFDSPSPDVAPFLIHKQLLGNGILIIENLADIASLTGLTAFEVAALPVRLHADAAPARVVAWVN